MIWTLHGNLGQPSDWSGTEQRLPAWEFRKIDLWSDPILPFPDFATWLNDLAKTDRHPILLGYSLGGRLAMQALTRAQPQLWKAAIFVSAHPGLTESTEIEKRRKTDHRWASQARHGNWIDFLTHWNRQPVLTSPIPESQLHLKSRRNTIADAFKTWSLAEQDDLRPALARCDVPQLWIAGERDEKFRTLAESAAATIPSGTYRVIPDCGHRVLLQNPSALAECVREFLENL